MTEQVSQSDNQRLVINTVGRNHYFHHAYADDHFCFTDDDLPELLEFCASHSNFPKEIPSAKSCEPCEPCRYIDEESETPCTQRGINLILESAERAKRQKEIPAATRDYEVKISELNQVLQSRMDEIGELYDKIRQQEQELKAATLELKEENKPGCFGAVGLPGKRNDSGCPCNWVDRCKQNQEDY
jgi:hypothetical protein